MISAGWLSFRQDGFSTQTFGTGFVRYESETLNTGLLSLEYFWKAGFEVDGYTIRPVASLSGTYLTDRDFETQFTYFGERYQVCGKIDGFFTTASIGVGFGFPKWSFDVSASQQWSANSLTTQLDLRSVWRF